MNNKKVRTLTGTAMLTAVGVALQYIEISIPDYTQLYQAGFLGPA